MGALKDPIWTIDSSTVEAWPKEEVAEIVSRKIQRRTDFAEQEPSSEAVVEG